MVKLSKKDAENSIQQVFGVRGIVAGYLAGGLFSATLQDNNKEIPFTNPMEIEILALLSQESKEDLVKLATTSCEEFVQEVVKGGDQKIFIEMDKKDLSFEIGINLALTEGGYEGLEGMEEPWKKLVFYASKTDFTWELILEGDTVTLQ